MMVTALRGKLAMRMLTSLVAAAFFLAPAAAAAQPVSAVSGPETYLQFHGGAFVPQGDVDRFDAGFDLGILFGARLTRDVSAEGGVGYYRATAGRSYQGCPPGLVCALNQPITESEALRVIPLTASVRLRHAFKFAEVAAFGGVGFHFARLSSTLESEGTRYVDTFSTSSAFGGHVGAAASFNLSPTMLVGVEAVRTFVPAKFEGVSTRLDGWRAALTLSYRL